MLQNSLRRPLLLAAGFGAVLSMTTALSGLARAAETAPVVNGVSQVHVTLVSDNGGACLVDFDQVKAGPITFTVTNQTATAITEVEIQSDNRILGEKENLAPGLPAVALTLTLGGGAYQIYCPGAGQELQPFTVTGKVAPAATGTTAQLLQDGTIGYAKYVAGVAASMVDAVKILKADIDAGDLAKARAEYPLARPFYERIESDVDSFVLPGFKATDNAGSLDYLIDMRASALDPKVGWHGFHAIERDLFQNNAITAETKAQAAELLTHVEMLAKITPTLTYKPEDLANGAADLLEEVQTTKVTGEEEDFSHIDLLDFAGNVEGAQQAFAFLEPGMMKIDPDLTARVQGEFAKVNAMLDTYRDKSQPGGYELYTAQVKAADAAKLSKAIQALQEPLSKIGEKVATAEK
ncbi:EfeM/EfeO family lipoprotein [Acidisoma cellulosilytica]|uniref:EfeM/EfeO family lipoprotein n=1 Tax=Acidisoma cellulosilyticum TaxID=2802395 RepID=A0A963Z2S6_9PROT|nr:iron uptake system protein EfeO [Acidisoma cellulosilyticum]MCB8881556.1 EfeM/EfeO family lipoprotein [Acidisoma cellulosilyticum]